MSIIVTEIRNPRWPSVSFPLDDNNVTFAILYAEKYSDPVTRTMNTYTGTMKPHEIEAMCKSVSEECKLITPIDWGYSCGRCLLWCQKEDLNSLYEIIGAFLSRGQRLYLQDGTQVTLSPEDHEGDLVVTQQRKLVASIRELIKLNILSTSLCSVPVHKDDFWTIPEGKELAKELREKHNYDRKN